MSIYGGVEAHQVFLEIAESLDHNPIVGISHQHADYHDNVTTLKSDLAEITYQPWLGYNSTSYAIFRVTSSDRQNPLRNESAVFTESIFVFGADDMGRPTRQVQIVLNYFCNEAIEPSLRDSQAYCCAPYAGPNILQKLILFVGSFSIIEYICSSLLRRLHVNYYEAGSWELAAEIRHVTAALATVSIALLSCFVADRTVLLEKVSKTVDSTTFVWVTSIFLLAGLATCKRIQSRQDPVSESKTPPPEHGQFLSRQQTEEWKGWMQIVILLYHYYGLSKVPWVYQLVRLLVSSYLFMTGFGHTTYFINTNDFSFQRSLSVLLRSNLLSVILAFTMGTRYDLYYFPVLTSVWFLIIWTTTPKTPAAGIDLPHCLRTLAISAVVVRLVLEAGAYIESTLDTVDGLGLGFPKIDGREFLFRFGLDMYIVYVGMATAFLYARYKLTYNLLPQGTMGDSFIWLHLRSRSVLLVSVLVISAYVLFCRAFQNKVDYNKWHPLVSPVPVMAFIFLRNSTRTLSAYHCQLFAWVGRCSLETFILQYHIWLAADARGRLRLGIFRHFDSSTKVRYALDLLEASFILTVFLSISSTTSKALSVLTKSLVGLRACVLLIVMGLWIVNLTWLHSDLGQHEYY